MVGAPRDMPAVPVRARMRMAAALAQVAVSRDPAARAVRRALAAAALGRLTGPERERAAAIEARRARLLADEGASGGVFVPSGGAPTGAFAPAAAAGTVADASMMLSLPPPWCVLLMKLVRCRAPRACVELGTGFGISAAYIAAALELNGEGSLTTIEGSAELAGLARTTLAELGLLGRTEPRLGTIETELADDGAHDVAYELAFIDAEHQTDAAAAQFAALLPRLADGAVVVLDDVNWAPMLAAHRRIAAHPRVSSAVVAGRLGIAVIGGARR